MCAVWEMFRFRIIRDGYSAMSIALRVSYTQRQWRLQFAYIFFHLLICGGIEVEFLERRFGWRASFKLIAGRRVQRVQISWTIYNDFGRHVRWIASSVVDVAAAAAAAGAADRRRCCIVGDLANPNAWMII